MANNDQSTGLWTRSGIPATIPKRCTNSRSWANFVSLEEMHARFGEFMREHPAEVRALHRCTRRLFLDGATPG